MVAPTEAFTRRLRDALGRKDESARVVWTQNRVRLVSSVRRSGRLEIRVSRRLLVLEPSVSDAVAAFVLGREGARDDLRAWFSRLPPAACPPRPRTREPSGRCYDLQAVLDEVWPLVSSDPCDVHITWGRRARRRVRRRTIQLGSYRAAHKEIRIHRVLDHEDVPPWFLSALVHHEVLHHVLGFGARGGRRILHGPEFRRREAEHPHFEAARRWEREHLARLLTGDLGPHREVRGR